ncbi:MAG: tRNA pseudouridine(38-40) synthase TruA [Deltaproteobacteria bacterium]|nr:tRNA pseudouridine(38-40) synthase TruA [Candidatus Anaeroferrophillus wilburensis]MBN2889895.1 tRNA pseudouridine(38-40) synthase TruA [Deltaproteobacteria bacterium]
MQSQVRTLKLVIAYDGSRYHGWQIQPNGITIQEELQHALAAMTGENLTVFGSGRTDAGVHAWGQVAHVATTTSIPEQGLWRGLNALLPDDIVIRSLSSVSAGFHARKSATGKTYCYCIDNQPLANPLSRFYSWHVRKTLDMAAIRQATRQLLGTHDFASFKAADGETATSVRTISRARVWRRSSYLLIMIHANGFLKNMVRNIVGTLYEIGLGKRGAEEMAAIVAAVDRRSAGITAPAKGLVLRSVSY